MFSSRNSDPDRSLGSGTLRMPKHADEYFVQRFRGGFAIVWQEPDGAGNRVRRRRQLASEDRASAEAEARQLWEGTDPAAWTVGKIMRAYMDTLTHKPSYPRRKDAWKAMQIYWENVDPALIDEPMCRQYRERRKVSNATARYELLQLSTALNWARTNGPKLSYKRTIWLPSTPERKERHLTREEFHRFFAEVRADHARLYVMIGIYTLARPGAILELTWDRVDFMRRLIDFSPAGRIGTRKRRTVTPISDNLLPHLQRAFEARTSQFVIEHGGEPLKSIKKAFEAASKRSAVHATPYTLRHTGAVWAAEAGVPMAELAQFMGHDDDRTTQKHYARFSPNYLSGVANAIGAVA